MGDLGCREGKKEGRNVVRGLVRGGWDLLVISLFNVEKARDEARELPTVRRYQFYDGVRLMVSGWDLSYLQTSLKARS